jgi:hypothetical protein
MKQLWMWLEDSFPHSGKILLLAPMVALDAKWTITCCGRPRPDLLDLLATLSLLERLQISLDAF